MERQTTAGPRKEHGKLSDLKFKSISHPLVAACVAIYGSAGIARTDDSPPAAKPAQTKSQLTASEVHPGLVNAWLRSQSSSFSAWDLGGQFRARYEHAEYLGPVDFSATGGHSSDNRMLLRTFVHMGYDPTPWLNFYAEGRDSRGFWDEPNPNPDQDKMDLR